MEIKKLLQDIEFYLKQDGVNEETEICFAYPSSIDEEYQYTYDAEITMQYHFDVNRTKYIEIILED